jgi:hypothetical protein
MILLVIIAAAFILTAMTLLAVAYWVIFDLPDENTMRSRITRGLDRLRRFRELPPELQFIRLTMGRFGTTRTRLWAIEFLRQQKIQEMADTGAFGRPPSIKPPGSW